MVVFGGIGLAMLTLYARQIQDARLAGISAALSIVFVLLLLVFVVPPLARNAGKEASQMNLPFEFTTGGPAIVRSLPYEGSRIDESQVFILGLDAPAKPETIVANAHCVAAGINEAIPVRLVTGNERKTILEQLRAENEKRADEERALGKQIREELKKLRDERKSAGT